MIVLGFWVCFGFWKIDCIQFINIYWEMESKYNWMVASIFHRVNTGKARNIYWISWIYKWIYDLNMNRFIRTKEKLRIF